MTRHAVPPERVVALVVGIERYGAGAAWDLPGPARDALRFRDWLLARGVPESRILLHLAPLPGSEPGAPFRPADHDSLRRALVTDVPERGGDALWVWWGGHGVLDTDEHLRLYSADATVADRRNIDLDSARALFRTDAVTGLARQMWMADACRTFDEQHHFPQTLPGERLPMGRRVQAHEQTVMLAAGRGQRAANDPERRLGLFSDIVLDSLPDDPLPDPVPLLAAVEARMHGLRKAGLTGQLPDYFLARPGWTTTGPPAPAPPAPAGAAPASPGHPMLRLIDALLAYPLMSDRDERQALVNELPADVVSRMPRHSMPRTDLVGILRTLRPRPRTLWQLYDAVTLLDPDPERATGLKGALQDFVEGTGPGT
ncbi:effector-associated domain 2-containing protein [Streptomyces sp. NRRL WC-3549]|uniref:effector-associated domain 2-containing protein n=1 Tax=Streptomyces sp. NRRL WC-3549 TaxID=1463925 RepID=UPI0004C5868F|nr:caspase family protein [Streptomyces sp. NRRL WC-3549]